MVGKAADGKATAVACANIAFIKYWGRKDDALRLPLNASISMNLDRATTTTTVAFDPALERDEVVIEGMASGVEAVGRVSAHLDRVRGLAGITTRARVASRNSFPAGAGIASSASAFAALSAAGIAAAGVAMDERGLTVLARLGSGSAARSIPAGFVEWYAGDRSEDSYAEQIAAPDHWDLCDLIALVQTGHKEVASTRGHALVESSPFADARLAAAERALPVVRDALLARDFDVFGEETELEAIRMHAVAMSSRPSVIYWSPATLAIMLAVREARADGVGAYFTIDAGANVHVLCREDDAADLDTRLRAVPGVLDVLVNRPGPGIQWVSGHLI